MDPIQQHFLVAIAKLRRCGFFESLSNQTDAQVAAALLKTLRERSSEVPFYREHPEYGLDKELLEYFAEPADEQAYKALAGHEDTLVWARDMEADVCKGNRVYEQVAAEYAKLSLGYLQPTNIVETWLSETGPVALTLEHGGQAFATELPYYDDWIAGEVFAFLDEIMHNQGFPAAIYTEVNTGQDAFLVRATETEKIQMEQELGWKFDWNSLEVEE